jgi:hypothetical protein
VHKNWVQHTLELRLQWKATGRHSSAQQEAEKAGELACALTREVSAKEDGQELVSHKPPQKSCCGHEQA